MELALVSDEQAVRQLEQPTGLDDAAGALRVAHELGNHPLALAAAAAMTGFGRAHPTYGDYLDALSMVEARPLDGAAAYPASVQRALQLAIRHAREVAPRASLLLDLMALLSPGGATCGFLARAVALVDTDGPVDDPDEVQARGSAAVDVLVEHALVERVDAVVIMHPLVQSMIRDDLTRWGSLDLTLRWAADALDAEAVAAAPGEADRDLEEHLDAVWHHAESATVPLHEETPRTLLRMRGWLLSRFIEGGDWDGAIEAGQRLYRDHLRVLGQDDPSTIAIGGKLGFAYQSAWQFDQAIQLYEVIVADQQRILGPYHPDTLTTRDNLAGAYHYAGQIDEAVALHEASLADAQRVLGIDHPRTLTIANNLASAYQTAGRLGRAISLYESVVSSREALLGADHEDTVAVIYNLATAYEEAGRLTEAVNLYRTALVGAAGAFGTDHDITETVAASLHVARMAVLQS